MRIYKRKNGNIILNLTSMDYATLKDLMYCVDDNNPDPEIEKLKNQWIDRLEKLDY